jgi:hypothetical protein
VYAGRFRPTSLACRPQSSKMLDRKRNICLGEIPFNASMHGDNISSNLYSIVVLRFMWRVGEWLSGLRPGETPSTMQHRGIVRCRVRVLATEQKRNVHKLLTVIRVKSLRRLVEAVKRPSLGVQGQISACECCMRRG